MPVPSTIRFRRLRASARLNADVQDRIDKLETYCPSLSKAYVLVEPATHHQRGARRYHVRLELTVSGETLVISQHATLYAGTRAMAQRRTRKQDETDPSHKLLAVAIHEAFEAARRRLQDYVRRQRGDVKRHVSGRRLVDRLSPAS